jgi:RNA-directed DNA polymerase
VLETAWRIARNRNGTSGVDGKSFKDIEQSAEGVAGFIKELHDALKGKTYQPNRVKRVYIPKSNGGQRPLGIPTIRDRVAQTATLLIIEPIFEADFLDCSFGFRPERSAHDALDAIKQNIKEGRTAIYDADLKSYFDTIPHDKLMACMQRRITDRPVLNLIRMWLEAPIEGHDEQGKKQVDKPKQGTPQGGVISPLLANLYLHWFDKKFNGAEGPYKWANARIIRYADDFVIMARYMGSRIIDFTETMLEQRFDLQINREKTHCIELQMKGECLNFLGVMFRYDRDLNGSDHLYLNIGPSRKSVQRERDALREMTGPEMCFKPVRDLILDINQQTKGWANYFRYGYPRKVFHAINWYVLIRLINHLGRRSQRPMRPPKGVSFYKHLRNLGWEPL